MTPIPLLCCIQTANMPLLYSLSFVICDTYYSHSTCRYMRPFVSSLGSLASAGFKIIACQSIIKLCVFTANDRSHRGSWVKITSISDTESRSLRRCTRQDLGAGRRWPRVARSRDRWITSTSRVRVVDVPLFYWVTHTIPEHHLTQPYVLTGATV